MDFFKILPSVSTTTEYNRQPEHETLVPCWSFIFFAGRSSTAAVLLIRWPIAQLWYQLMVYYILLVTEHLHKIVPFRLPYTTEITHRDKLNYIPQRPPNPQIRVVRYPILKTTASQNLKCFWASVDRKLS